MLPRNEAMGNAPPHVLVGVLVLITAVISQTAASAITPPNNDTRTDVSETETTTESLGKGNSEGGISKTDPLIHSSESKVQPTDAPDDTFVVNEWASVDPFSFSPEGAFPASFNDSQNVDPCRQTARCEPLEETTCLGVHLPYRHTSLDLTGLPSQQVAREHLEFWSRLRNIPRCWAVVQPLLCAVFFPRCDRSSVQLPSQKMCVITRGPCRLVEEDWPPYLRCKEDFPHKCKNSARELKFNTTGQCVSPLVATEEESSWYEGVKGCGIQCANPIFTPQEHEDLHQFVATIGGICLACAALTVLTYLIDWRAANKYPVLIIFYINGCFLIASIGFMVQFHPGVRQDLTCRSDGTLRQAEPSSGGNLSCVVVFVCIYYFMVAGGMWLIILAYSLHTSFKSYAAGLCGEELERRAAYFHLIAWSLPLVLTITIMALAEVEADSLAGICFLSSAIHIRIGFLLLPVILIVIIGGFFLGRGMMKLIYLKMECCTIISDNANSKIVETIIRLAIITITLVTFTAITVYCHIYQYKNQHLWDDALRDYIMCVSNITADVQDSSRTPCKIAERPSINLYKLHLLALFGAGIIMSSWCWTPNTIQAWKRFFRRVAGVPSEEPLRLAKHKVIAQAFAKRHDLNNMGRLSISLHSMHDDPIGLNFEMNSMTSGDLSSAWAHAIPHLMTRRGALVGSTALGLRRNSVDSEYSVSRRFSLESGCNNRSSRRHSLDSQMSFHVSDAERLAALYTAARFGRRKRRDWFSLKRGRRMNAWDRRGSNTSDDSNLGSMILPAVTMNQDTLFTNMMKRLNLSSDDPTRSERIVPSAPPAKSVNLNAVPLPGQAPLESEDDVGAENHAYADNDSITHTVLNNVLKSVELKRQEENYTRAATALEEGLLSSAQGRVCSRRGFTTESREARGVSIGVQASIIGSPVVTMVDKGVQVSSPLLSRGSQASQTHDRELSPTHAYKVQNSGKKTIGETSFMIQRKLQNNERPGTPVTKLPKKLNVSNDKSATNKNMNSSHGSHKRSASARSGNISSKSRRSRGESADVMTVLDMDEDSD